MSTALLVIDAQQSFLHRPYFSDRELPRYLAAQNALIEGFARLGLPAVRIFHCDGPQSTDNPFALASGLVRPLDGVRAWQPAAEFIKHRHSALVGTGLEVWLVAHGIRRLVVSGIRTEQCCETTTRHASDLGWEVDFVPEATLSFEIARPGGYRLSTDTITEHTCAALDGRFATVCSVSAALERASIAPASRDA